MFQYFLEFDLGKYLVLVLREVVRDFERRKVDEALAHMSYRVFIKKNTEDLLWSTGQDT